jgi:hypothetical protein
VEARNDTIDITSRILAFYAKKFTPRELFLVIDEPPDESGRFRDIYMDLTGVWIDGVRVEKLTFRMNDARFVLPSEEEGGEVQCLSALAIYAHCLLKEEDVNRKLAEETFGRDERWESLFVKITPSGVYARGNYIAKALFIPFRISIEIESGLRIVNNRELWMDNCKIRLNSLDVPSYVTQKALGQIQPLLDLGRFPLPLRLHSVEFQEGQAVFSTRIPPELPNGGITYHYRAE